VPVTGTHIVRGSAPSEPSGSALPGLAYRRDSCQVILTHMRVIDVNSLPADPLEALRELSRVDVELEALRRERVEAARSRGAPRGTRSARAWGCPVSRYGSTTPARRGVCSTRALLGLMLARMRRCGSPPTRSIGFGAGAGPRGHERFACGWFSKRSSISHGGRDRYL
jgi:hypothetical protein